MKNKNYLFLVGLICVTIAVFAAGCSSNSPSPSANQSETTASYTPAVTNASAVDYTPAESGVVDNSSRGTVNGAYPTETDNNYSADNGMTNDTTNYTTGVTIVSTDNTTSDTKGAIVVSTEDNSGVAVYNDTSNA